MVLTMAIASTTAAVAIPTISSWQGRHATLREAKRVQRALERAYVMALLRETAVIVTFDSGGMLATSPDNVLLFSVTPSPGVSIQLKSKEQQAITFYPSHTATPTTILIVRSESQCSVILSLRGRARRECSW